MSYPVINAPVRTELGKGPNRRLRASGMFPAVLYGKGKEPVSLALEPRQIADLLNGTYGKNTVVSLHIEGEDTPRLAIFQDYQVDPIRRTMMHMDLLEIVDDQPLVLKVPVTRLGHSEQEKLGSKAFMSRTVVTVRCMPADIPPSIVHDMTKLGISQSHVNVADLEMPEGVEALFDDNYNVIRVKVPRAMLDEPVAGEGEEGEEGAEAAEGEDGAAATSDAADAGKEE